MPTVKATFTADISQFRASLAQATTVVTGFDRTVGQVNRDLARFGNQFSGATIARQAETIAKAIEQVGGVTRLTDSEIKRANATIQEAVSKYRALGTQAPADVQRLAKELQNATTQTRSFGESIKSSLGSFVSGIGVGVGLSVFNSISQGLQEIAANGAKLGPIRQGFDAMQGGALQAEETLRRMRASTRGLVDDLALMTSANRGVLLGLTEMGIDMAEVAGVATILGRAVGQDATKSTEDLTIALARQSPMILDNLGIKLNLTEANERYAASLGKTVDQLTDEEKKLAFASAAMDAAREKAKALGDQQLTVAENIQVTRVAVSGILTDFAAMANQASLLVIPLQRLAETMQLIRAAGLGSSLRFGVSTAVESVGGLLNSIPGAKFTPLGLLGAASLQGLQQNFGASGSDFLNVMRGAGSVDSLTSIGKQLAAEATGRDTVTAAVRRQAAAGEARTTALRKEREEAQRLEAVWQRMLRPTQGVNTQLGLSSIGGIAGARAVGVGNVPGLPSPFSPQIGINQFDPLFKQFGISGAQSTNLSTGLQQTTKLTRDWAASLQGVAQAFARLGQIAGPSLDGVTRGFGSIIGAADTSREVVSALSRVIEGLQTPDGKQTTGGRALSGGLAGLTIGTQLGGLLTNRAGGFAAGAAGGAATGALAGGWVGAGVGALVGGLAGMFASAANAAARRAAKDISAKQLEAQFGGLENLLGTVGRLGLSQQSFLERFYGDPKAFGQAVSELNAALERERQIAEKLSKALQAAAAAGGVLAQTDFRNLATLRRGGPGDEAAGEFLTGQTQSLISGLEQMLQSGALSPAGVSGAGIALGSAFALLREQGVSVVDALRTLEPAMQAFQDAAVLAGKGSTAEFDALKSLLDTLNSESLGPFVQGALGAGQALGALANTGMITQDAFAGLSSAIAEAFYALERDGRGGVDAVRLLQGPLQNVWQLMEDFGLQTDEGTQRLIDFALEAGLIGEHMRPAADRMAEALDRLIERMDALLARFADLAGVSFPSIPEGLTNFQAPDGTTVQVPGAATGGVVTRPTLLMAGEREAEAIIPLSRLRGLSGGGGGTVVVPVSIDGREITRVVAKRLQGQAQVYTGVA